MMTDAKKRLFKKLKLNQFNWFTALVHLFLFVYALSMVVLLVWAFFAALKSNSEFRYNTLWLPKGKIWEWEWGNFSRVFKEFVVPVEYRTGELAGRSVKINLMGLVTYSLLYAVGSAFVGVAAKCVTAYVVSRFDFRIGRVIYGAVILTMMLPIVGSAPSEIAITQALGIYDTFIGAWIQKASFIGLYFLIFYDSFRFIPKDYVEAATLDGAGEFTIFFKIMLPLVKNTFVMVFLLLFIEYWNDYQTPLLYLPTHPTVMYATQRLSQEGKSGYGTPMKMASCIIVAIPLIVLFSIFSDKIMGDLTVGGVKG
ncbi:MAG: carbohydrate ABC transporter permease [Clostridia bacterium]|nr:carbohydrate ABC transporter permease [Clostridia bacterium]